MKVVEIVHSIYVLSLVVPCLYALSEIRTFAKYLSPLHQGVMLHLSTDFTVEVALRYLLLSNW